jgi:hypothetical protein
MKIGLGMLTAVLLAGITLSAQAEAQGMPQGSYLQSCRDIGIQGDSLVAVCRTVDGRGQRTTLAAVNHCVGDIGNNNGNLQCNYDGGAPQPGYGSSR